MVTLAVPWAWTGATDVASCWVGRPGSSCRRLRFLRTPPANPCTCPVDFRPQGLQDRKQVSAQAAPA